jgi:SAM-dependent methyltransferase
MSTKDFTTTRRQLDETFTFVTGVEERLLATEVFSRPVTQVIDVASGTGRLLPCLLTHAQRVLAVELEPAFVAQAKSNLTPQQRERVEWIVGDVRDVDTQVKADAIVVSGLLIYLSDPEISELFSDLARRLNPGGVIWSREPVANAYEWRREENERFPAAYYRARSHLQESVCAGGELKVRRWGYIDSRMLVSRFLRKNLASRWAFSWMNPIFLRVAKLEARYATQHGPGYEDRIARHNNAYAMSWTAYELAGGPGVTNQS